MARPTHQPQADGKDANWSPEDDRFTLNEKCNTTPLKMMEEEPDTVCTSPATQSPQTDTTSGLEPRGRKSKPSSRKEILSDSTPSEASLLSDIISDLRRLPRAAYPYWKWPLLAYFVWMVFTWAAMSVYTNIVDRFEPLCSTPWLRQKLPWCYVPSSSTSLEVAKLPISCHRELEEAVMSTGKGLGLAMDILDSEFAIRDLNIRVQHSALKCREDLSVELNKLISLTMQTSDCLTDFTSLLASTADAIISFDHLALRDLQAILDHQNNTPSLLETLVSSLAPLSAFERRFKTEEALREIFLRNMDQMTSRLPALIKEASHLCHLLDHIFKVLGRVRSITLDEFKDTPEMNILVKLWDRLSRSNDYADGKSRLTLLNDVTMYYLTAADIMINNLSVLKKMRADLRQLRHIRAVPVLVWQDMPLENTTYMINQAMKRLEHGRQKIDGIEPDEFSFPMSTAAATILALSAP